MVSGPGPGNGGGVAGFGALVTVVVPDGAVPLTVDSPERGAALPETDGPDEGEPDGRDDEAGVLTGRL
ncbi:putative protein OS=Tsukamurella paurometabola (strain ATCC 8368 / DSM / CCUG 35730 /CIP 100753 / JCM 10117 / KCTC 9821 / NBRC 16120 / NCIMB 702349/ NCTC 13040) OX=521096 GN=Tpau_3023 PE=4 SV=1 [Tsukamurella paurometabola]|uniref:Uncharacterized protein n=1 Tax=Tsukamurella paurometabola (strain ATCC 8368 / DSM 20162 / CCUG 35730 / CIP 100753 / JCM 10117 / KCTC 9821 / NBRC 16120 / NCIMB 702349 / NCTC 13040) TaxID=521096 RepID=D5UUB4_TSUPD|nr:hypothetical protein Tpau_3023 [Tsukamurella paurometabola DSM 20162]SUP36464.1 Uncharacterised protein [Tsukamurella paurometabola]